MNAMKMALEALKTYREFVKLHGLKFGNGDEAIAALTEAIKQQGEPVAWRITTHDGIVWIGAHPSSLPNHKSEPLYTSAPTIPEGWIEFRPAPIPEGCQIVPKEPTPEMMRATLGWYDGGKTYGEQAVISSYKAMLSAAPEYKGEKK